MKRTELKQLASTLATQVSENTFEYWSNQSYPITWEQEHKGCLVQVEIERLEQTESRIHLMIAVDDGTWPSAFVPASADAIVTKGE